MAGLSCLYPAGTSYCTWNSLVVLTLTCIFSSEVCPITLSSPVKSTLISSTTFEGLDKGKVIKLVSSDHNANIIKSSQTGKTQKVGSKTDQAESKRAEGKEGDITLLFHFRSQSPASTTTTKSTNHQVQLINQIKHAQKRTSRGFPIFYRQRLRQRLRRGADKNTSKFTGRVVGSSNDDKLSSTVKTLIDNLYRDVWVLQENVTQSTHKKGKTLKLASIKGAFSSNIKENFHGCPELAELRHDDKNSIRDVNSVSTLMILHSLMEAEVFGRVDGHDRTHISNSIRALKDFQVEGGSSPILSLRPPSITQLHTASASVLKTLKTLNDKDACDVTKVLSSIKHHKGCAAHFNKTQSNEHILSDVTSPDMMASFSNVALGAVFAIHKNVFKDELKLWSKFNRDGQSLIQMMKASLITFNFEQYVDQTNGTVEISPRITPSQVTTTSATNKDTTEKENKHSTSNIHDEENLTNVSSSLDTFTSAEPVNSVSNFTESTVTLPINPAMPNLKEKRQLAEHSSNNIDTSLDSTFSRTKNQYMKRNSIKSGMNSNNTSKDSKENADTNMNNNTETSKTDSIDNIHPDVNSHVRLINNNDSVININRKNGDATTVPIPPTTVSATTRSIPNSNNTNGNNTDSSNGSINGSINGNSNGNSNNNKTNSNGNGNSNNSSPTTAYKESIKCLDSMTYYSIKNYLDWVKVNDNKHPVVMMPQWVTKEESDCDEIASTDLTSTCTVIHSLVVASKAGWLDISSDLQLQEMMTSSLKMMTWFVKRKDELMTAVVLSPFPSHSQLYWLMARLAFQLDRQPSATDKDMFGFARDDITNFIASMRKEMTFSVLSQIKDAGLGSDGKTRVFVDDVIGVADLDDNGKSKVSGDDRVFSSAMAANTLISTWTHQDHDGNLLFIEETTDDVRIAVNSLVNYVSVAVMDDSHLMMGNAFMASRVKNCDLLPDIFPSNTKPSNIHGVKGYVEESTYATMLKDSTDNLVHQDAMTCRDAIFPYFSNLAYTKATSLLAISQAANIDINNKFKYN